MFHVYKAGSLKTFPPEVEINAKILLNVESERERIVYQAFRRAPSSTHLQLTVYIIAIVAKIYIITISNLQLHTFPLTI